MHKWNGDNSARPKNRELTKRRLIDAVGRIIRTKGYKALGVNAIAREADVNKKLIYRYFKNVDTLIETYILENDYWMNVSRSSADIIESQPDPGKMKEVIVSLLRGQFDYFLGHESMQSIILWGITEQVDMLNSIGHVREIIGHIIFEKTDAFFKDTGINLRAISAILVGGIYYMILRSAKNGGMISDINVNSAEGREEILKSVGQIIDWSFEQARSAKNK